jgi:hypothetical protein
MALIGILVCLSGFAVSVGGLALTTSIAGRMTVALIGIAISLAGIIGFVNRAYQRNAIWRKHP